MSDTPDPKPPVLKRKTLLTSAPASTSSGPKLVSDATAAANLPRARFLTPAMQKQLEEEQVQQAQIAEQESARIAAEQEAARIAAEQETARIAAEQEAARIAAEQEAARIAAEQEAARIAAEQEAARIAAEQEAARIAAEQEAARIAAEQEAAKSAVSATANTSVEEAIDPKIQAALDQIKLAQEALAAAQQQAMQMASMAAVPPPSSTASAPAVEETKTPEPEKKVLFKVGSPAPQKSAAPQTADELKKKISASLNAATTVASSSAAPSPVLSPAESAPPSANALPPIRDLPETPQVMPEAIWKKKSFKIGVIIGACILILSSILIVKAINAKDEQRKKNDYLTALCKVGTELGQKSIELGGAKGSDLKYDESKYKIKVTPNEKDAKILLARIGSKDQPGGWESAAHHLAVMGQLDPKIAKMIIDELGNNPKLYTDSHYMMLTSILAYSKHDTTQKLFPTLMKKLEAAKQFKKEALVLKQMRYGMTPADIPGIMKYLTDPKTNAEIANAARECIRSITHNANDAGKTEVSSHLIKELRNSPNEADLPAAQRSGLFSALALSATPEALAYFEEYLKDKDPKQMRIAIRSMGDWGDDNVVPLLMKLRQDPVLTADANIKNDLDRTLLQRLSKDGERTEDQGTALFQPLLDEADALAKNAKSPKEEEQAQMLKLLIISATSQLTERPYVKNILNHFKKDSDEKVSSSAKRSEEKMKDREKRKNTPQKSTADKAKEWEKRFAQ